MRPWLQSMFSTGDVVQEVFISVLRDIRDFDGRSEAQFENYLATLTRNRIVDAVRFHEAVCRDRRRVATLETDAYSDREAAQQNLVDRDELRCVHAVLQTLRPRERALLQGRFLSGHSFAELADDLGYASADSARKCFRVAQARLALRLSLR